MADFFCGCGTTIAVAQQLNRQWFGVDISHLAIKLIVKRLQDTYGTKYDEIRHIFEIHGIPIKMPMTTQGVFKTAGKHIQASTQEQLL
ncbi:type II DNA modification enzyme [Candidatus Vecturithrix granuli]|uniref:Type II DNA modification enzyme n=1 Tax=Vecturithrix granuli TaxID=1499967 RepID=A0A081C7C5_VECG1|nr:type II DNA modification enzyme [Candidatus Vecturithrix granuli]